jgi:ABC-type transport system substrate-binding protein
MGRQLPHFYVIYNCLKQEGFIMSNVIGKSVSKMFLAFSLCLVLFAASPVNAIEIVLATAEEMQGIDVQQINWEYLPHELIYEPLFHLDPKTNAFVPAAASAWKITDKNEIIFTVPRDGRKFSNGTPFTPEAVKASFERFIRISPYTDDMAAVESLKVEGDDVIFICNSSPVPAMVNISTAYGGIVDVTEAGEKGDEAVKSGIATFGPFKVDEWVQGSHLRIVPNENFKTRPVTRRARTVSAPRAMRSLISSFSSRSTCRHLKRWRPSFSHR